MNIRNLLYGLLVLSLLLSTAVGLTGCTGVGRRVTDQQADGPITQYGNGYRFDKNGWIYLHIEGEPHERGMQYGYLVAPELAEILRSVKYLTYWQTGKECAFFQNTVNFAHQ